MKVIELLNKIANGEEVPKKIKYNNLIYNWDITGYLHYEDEHTRERAFLEGYRTDKCLNDEVEIIEENKPIEELTYKGEKIGYGTTKEVVDDADNYCNAIYSILDSIGIKVNELVKKVNEERIKNGSIN